jgi:hypothetical protein
MGRVEEPARQETRSRDLKDCRDAKDMKDAEKELRVEGVGIRSTCRMTGASKGAVTKLIADLGPVCAAYMDQAFRERTYPRLASARFASSS